MLDVPKTLDEAKKYRYGTWAGNPKGADYNEGSCAYEVSDSDGWHYYQCSRKNGHGPEGIYCKQHAKKVKE
jgi:hypothetical protein